MTRKFAHPSPTFASAGNIAKPDLLNDGPGPKPGLTPLMHAAWRGDVTAVARELSNHANPNARDSSGATALMYATRAESLTALTALIEAGADPNIRTYQGQTALMAATISYPLPKEKMEVLLKAGADSNAQDKTGQTALALALSYRLDQPDIAALLQDTSIK